MAYIPHMGGDNKDHAQFNRMIKQLNEVMRGRYDQEGEKEKVDEIDENEHRMIVEFMLR